MTVYGSVIAPQPVPRLIATQATVTIHVDSPGLPNWWAVASGGCRSHAITLGLVPSDLDGACPDVYGGNVPITFLTINVNSPQIRIVSGASLTTDLAQIIGYDGVTECGFRKL